MSWTLFAGKGYNVIRCWFAISLFMQMRDRLTSKSKSKSKSMFSLKKLDNIRNTQENERRLDDNMKWKTIYVKYNVCMGYVSSIGWWIILSNGPILAYIQPMLAFLENVPFLVRYQLLFHHYKFIPKRPQKIASAIDRRIVALPVSNAHSICTHGTACALNWTTTAVIVTLHSKWNLETFNMYAKP